MTLGDLYEELTLGDIIIMAYYGFVHVVMAIGIVVKTNRMQARWDAASARVDETCRAKLGCACSAQFPNTEFHC